jgi:Na+/H+ antiporter NhaD/arsenite permease-like protein
MVVIAIISNSAGLLTLIGDPATFRVGSSIGLTFAQFMQKLSLGGLLKFLILVPRLPMVMRDVWHVQRTLPAHLQPQSLRRPAMAAFSLLVLAVMIILFMLGESLPTHIVPPAVAIIAASLALLVVCGARIEPTETVCQLAVSAVYVMTLFLWGAHGQPGSRGISSFLEENDNIVRFISTRGGSCRYEN